MDNTQSTLYGKTWPGLFRVMKARISAGSWKKSQKPIFQCLKVENGQTPEWLELREQGGADRHAIAYAQSGFAEYKEGVGTLTKSRGVSGSGQMLVAIAEKIAQTIKYRVRRLTPLECERLDGFPDEWTRYGASGKEMSDNVRYMALGNSIAVPCAERVFIGINKAESEENEA